MSRQELRQTLGFRAYLRFGVLMGWTMCGLVGSVVLNAIFVFAAGEPLLLPPTPEHWLEMSAA
eukprot:5061198-Amphidinium_carterae.1